MLCVAVGIFHRPQGSAGAGAQPDGRTEELRRDGLVAVPEDLKVETRLADRSVRRASAWRPIAVTPATAASAARRSARECAL
jgi:hypothetical protein